MNPSRQAPPSFSFPSAPSWWGWWEHLWHGRTSAQRRNVGRACLSEGIKQSSGGLWRKLLTLLTASVAMPSMAAPPTPSTSLALESMKSIAVPSPLSSFFPLRLPFTPAILPLKAGEMKRMSEKTKSKIVSLAQTWLFCTLETHLAGAPPDF